MTVTSRKKALLQQYFVSKNINYKKDAKKSWEYDKDTFTDEPITINTRKTYLSTTKVLIYSSRYIKRITGKSMFRSYKNDPERGLSFSDIDKFISGKDNSHIHSRLNDTRCGYRISNSLKRWVRFMNFDDKKPRTEMPPSKRWAKYFDDVHSDSNQACIALKHNGHPCNRKCLSDLRVCGLHRDWGESKKHKWKLPEVTPTETNNVTVINIDQGTCQPVPVANMVIFR